jgi:transcriptional regulator with XRE-family HTH domain
MNFENRRSPEMRSFRNIAKLIKSKRLGHPKGYSQSELSNLLGYKNGQFISNVERGLCNIPLKMLSKIVEILDISPEELKNVILLDHGETLDNYLSLSTSSNSEAVEENEKPLENNALAQENKLGVSHNL